MRPKKTVTLTPLASLGRPAATKKPSTSATSAAAKTPTRTFALDVPFTYRAVASAAGARWDEQYKVFVYRGPKLPETLVPFAAQPYSLEAFVERQLDPERSVRYPRPGEPLIPRPHQRVAMAQLQAAHDAGLPGFLLADDVGLGKTISTWGGLLELDCDTVLIVCPLAVVAHWRRTILGMGDGGKTVVIVNYERLPKLFALPAPTRKKPQKKKVRTQKGLARHGEAMSFDVVVFDESHKLKNPTTARAKFGVKLVANADFTLWLSATAGQNPLELSYLAPLLAAATGEKATNLKDFEAWCQKLGLGITRGAYGKWDWAGNPEDCEKVRSLLFDAGEPGVPAGLRRRPEDIAGWPEINRILTPIGLEGEARHLYEQLWTEFRKELALAPNGENPRGALAATLRLRQKSSLLRVPGTVELALELLDNGHQVAISVAFLETLTALKEALDPSLDSPCALIHGRLSAAEREAERLRFQRGEATVCLFTVEEGISLHQGEHNEAPRSEIIHDLRWSAIQMAQIEGRCHRDGRFAQVYWAYADDTLEDKIAVVVSRRIASMKGMVGDDIETLREIERLLRGE